MKYTRIISDDSFIVPVAVQSAIKRRFSLSKIEEVNVKKSKNEFDVYQDEEYKNYICSFDLDGNEI